MIYGFGVLVWVSLSIVAIPNSVAQGSEWITPNANVITWTSAGYYVGQNTIVEGAIVYTYVSKGTSFLNFHNPYQGYFYGVVFASDSNNFKCSIAQFYLNKEVRITGMIQLDNGVPEIIVHAPSQVEVAYQGFTCS